MKNSETTTIDLDDLRERVISATAALTGSPETKLRDVWLGLEGMHGEDIAGILIDFIVSSFAEAKSHGTV